MPAPRAPRITKDAIAHNAAQAASANAARSTGAAPAAPDYDLLLAKHIALAHDYLALRARLAATLSCNDQLCAQIDALEKIAKVGAYAPVPKPPRPARIVPPDELARVAAMARAKAAAAASGKSERAVPLDE